jgi:UDPglucose 6-dehydrogenase
MASGRRVCVIGAGYVGLVTAACLAERGFRVKVVEVDPQRLATLRAGCSPIHEPGLEALLRQTAAAGRFCATGDVGEGMQGAAVAMIAVGTPPLADGSADLSQVRTAVAQAAGAAAPGAVIAIKSTVPPGTTASLRPHARRGARSIPVVACPEFLREGNAIEDFRHPARIVVGGDDPAACRRVMALFDGLDGQRIVTDSTSAEMIKYGANTFLALKISFINEIAHLCELIGGDIAGVADGIGADPRIGRAFLNAGLGFGGSCFPKDVRALELTASDHGHTFSMLKAAIEVNAQQRRRFVAKLQNALDGQLQGRHIAVLGLAFKPGTDDMRQAASIDIIRHLQDLGATVVASDPVAIDRARHALPTATMTDDPYACVRGADAVALVTEWDDYVELDWARVASLVRRRIVVDGRNALDPRRLTGLGFTYYGVGRGGSRMPLMGPLVGHPVVTRAASAPMSRSKT